MQTPARSGIRVAGHGDLPRLTQTLAAAFFADPVLSWLIPDERSRQAALRRLFAIELKDVVGRRGQAWTNEQLTGAALSMPPGMWRVPWRVLIRQAGGYARIFRRRLGHATALITRLESRHLREPHHYFPYIGVEPSAQGRGIGTQLMQPTLARCDERQLPAYLEATSERNALLYFRLGFRTIDEVSVADSPTLLLMMRPPTAGA